MANHEHLYTLIDGGIAAWNEWRRANPSLSPDLQGADLRKVNLDSTNLILNLSRTDLRNADLRDTDLPGVNLDNANLSGADLTAADLTGASLRSANMTCASLIKAHLNEADLFMAHLIRANLFSATLHSAHLLQADLSDAILCYAELIDATLHGATLSNADLFNASLTQADLFQARLYGANLKGASLLAADLGQAHFDNADLTGADLSMASLIGTTFNGAILTDCRVFGISAWAVATDGAIQTNLIVTRANEPTITVDSLDVAQFIYLLTNSQKIRGVIDTITSKVVLILGRFTPERKAILEIIRNTLRRYNYLPILFDFERPASRDFIETVSILAHMARFVIADVTDPRIVLEEVPHVVRNVSVPLKPLLLMSSGAEPVTLYNLRVNHRSLLDTLLYRDADDLLNSLAQEVIAPAEAKAKELSMRASGGM